MNSSSAFLILKSVNHGLLFYRGILIATSLSISDYAEWGNVMLISAYYLLLSFGIPFWLNDKLKNQSKESESVEMLRKGSITLCLILLPILFIAVLLRTLNTISTSHLNLVAIVIILIFHELFRNYHRFNKRFFKIWLSEFFNILLFIILIFTFNNLNFNSLLTAFVISLLFGLFLLLPQRLFNFNNYTSLDIISLKDIYEHGIKLLFFSFSSYLQFILLRFYVVNLQDNVLNTSYFNLAWLLGNSGLVLLNTYNWYKFTSFLYEFKNQKKSITEVYQYFTVSIVIAMIGCLVPNNIINSFIDLTLEQYTDISPFLIKKLFFLLSMQFVLFPVVTYLTALDYRNLLIKGSVITGALTFITLCIIHFNNLNISLHKLIDIIFYFQLFSLIYFTSTVFKIKQVLISSIFILSFYFVLSVENELLALSVFLIGSSFLKNELFTLVNTLKNSN